jgi:hypothetical protein
MKMHVGTVCVLVMNEKTPERVFQEYITIDDLSKFQWEILKYMCSVAGVYDIFPEVLLFHRTNLKSYIDSKVKNEYLHDKGGVLYKLIMDNVMNQLIERAAVEVVEEYQYGNLKMILYGRENKLKDMCDDLKEYETEDFTLLDKLFPKNV